jgi:hypothetical protein
MKILIVESPWRHLTPKAKENKEDFEMHGNVVEIAITEIEAIEKLKSFSADVVYIHHHGFETVRYLKEKHPNLKYIGEHGDCLIRPPKGPPPRTMAFEMEQEYDYVPYLTRGHTTYDILKKIQNSKNS